MKHLFVTILFLCAVNLNLSAQEVTYDPCGELRVAMLTADRLLFEGKLDEALTKLNKFKNDPEMQNCPEMKDGVVDYKMKEIQKKIAERDGQKPPQQTNTTSTSSLTSYKQCPDGNHPHLIDLGLPSGTKWACCNVDAKNPEDYGGYYAWGETVEKEAYTSQNYQFKKDKKGKKFLSLGSSICGTQYDVAHVKWGGLWQMPTLDQIKELKDKCKHEWTTQNGVEGRKFTGPNGASIFLPAAGYRNGAGLNDSGTYGYYWSGTQNASFEYYAYYLYFSSDNANTFYGDRSYGRSVRPVAR